MHARTVRCLLLLAGVSGARQSHADDKVACVQAADAAQEQRTAGRLKDARNSLHTCARDVCPSLVSSDCTRWLAELEASMPTIVIRAEGSGGEDLTDVHVDLDGRPIADKLEGLPLDVDPGPHTLTCRYGAGKVWRQEIIVHTAEKNRNVTLRLESSSPRGVVGPGTSTKEVAPRPNAAAWIFAGIAVAGAASFAYFGLRGSAEVRDMRSECAGHCPSDRVDAAHQKLLIADISLGTAILSAGVATYFFWSAKASPRPVAAREISVTPLTGGIAAVWVERF